MKVAGKTDAMRTVRNEAGIVSFPDGQVFAVANFTRSHTVADRNAVLDTAIGPAAAIAVAALRS